MTAAVIDSHPIFADALTGFLERWYQGIEVSRFSSVAMFDAQRGSFQPDFILLGANHLFNFGEIMIFETVKRTWGLTPIIIFYSEPDMLIPFLKCGVNAFVAKNERPESLQECIASIMNGNRCIGEEVSDWLVRQQPGQ